LSGIFVENNCKEGLMKRFVSVIVIGLFLLCPFVAKADTTGTAPEAEAMVKKAVDYIKTQGKSKAYAEFSNTKGKLFIDRDLYVVVYDVTGTVLAHGQNPALVGKNIIWMKDADGKAFVKERVELAKTKNKFWQDYKYTDPLDKKIHPKSTYCEKQEDFLVCCGAYK
jgi:cytochrome c